MGFSFLEIPFDFVRVLPCTVTGLSTSVLVENTAEIDYILSFLRPVVKELGVRIPVFREPDNRVRELVVRVRGDPFLSNPEIRLRNLLFVNATMGSPFYKMQYAFLVFR